MSYTIMTMSNGGIIIITCTADDMMALYTLYYIASVRAPSNLKLFRTKFNNIMTL